MTAITNAKKGFLLITARRGTMTRTNQMPRMEIGARYTSACRDEILSVCSGEKKNISALHFSV